MEPVSNVFPTLSKNCAIICVNLDKGGIGGKGGTVQPPFFLLPSVSLPVVGEGTRPWRTPRVAFLHGVTYISSSTLDVGWGGSRRSRRREERMRSAKSLSCNSMNNSGIVQYIYIYVWIHRPREMHASIQCVHISALKEKTVLKKITSNVEVHVFLT